MSESNVEAALADIREGKMVVVCDGYERENEGDLVMAAQFVTPDSVNFMTRQARGLICLALTAQRCDELGLEPAPRRGRAPGESPFTVSIEAREGISTGISARDRAHTIQVAISPDTGADDLARPGHIFPLRSREGGVLERTGHTEAAVDIARLAGVGPAAVLCEILASDGRMATSGDLSDYAREHDLRVVSVAELVAYRYRNERLIERVAVARLPTHRGLFKMIGYRSLVDGAEHVAAVYGDPASSGSPLVRVHSECVTSEVFGSLRCDCARQLDLAMQMIVDEGAGVVVYLAQEGRGIGLLNKLRAYELQDSENLDTVDANLAIGLPVDLRDFGIGAQILADLGLDSLRLLTNNPKKLIGLEGYGMSIAEQIPLAPEPLDENRAYLQTKADRLGHRLAAALASQPPTQSRPPAAPGVGIPAATEEQAA